MLPRSKKIRWYLVVSIFALSAIDLTCFAQSGTTSPQSTGASDEEQIRTIALFGLIPIVVAFSFVTFIFYRSKREAYFKKTEAELKLSVAEVELKALRAQINPHFIFNCMNSIHHYMHRNDIRRASDYLIKFSQLIRMVLENSALKLNSLRDELQILELYIQLEQLRLDYKFSYTIDVDKAIDQDGCELPGFLIQPFVENAIWHELTRISSDGKLEIRFIKDEKNSQLMCQVVSTGVGRQADSTINVAQEGVKKTSLGMSLIRDRIDVLNRTHSVRAHFNTRDISVPDENRFGYFVEIFIPASYE